MGSQPDGSKNDSNNVLGFETVFREELNAIQNRRNRRKKATGRAHAPEAVTDTAGDGSHSDKSSPESQKLETS
jgi:c-di-GMP-binding flagellar brake protein YcgR